MHPNNVDPEEMAKRHDLDFIASLNMIDEGAPVPLEENEKKKKDFSKSEEPPKNSH